jgi:hypothetical protein
MQELLSPVELLQLPPLRNEEQDRFNGVAAARLRHGLRVALPPCHIAGGQIRHRGLTWLPAPGDVRRVLAETYFIVKEAEICSPPSRVIVTM